MANKSRFVSELTEAEIDALVNMEELLILELLIKQFIILLALAGYKMIITNAGLCASLVIYHFISSTLL